MCVINVNHHLVYQLLMSVRPTTGFQFTTDYLHISTLLYPKINNCVAIADHWVEVRPFNMI